MAGFRIGNKTTAILGAIASAITGLLGLLAGRKTAPTQPVDKRPIVTVTSPTVTLSPDLVPAVLTVVKQQQDAQKKAADAKAQALAKAEAEVARLKADMSQSAASKAN